MKNTIKLCVFDLDGTLLDTQEFILHAFEYSLAKHGFHFTKDEIMKNIGVSLPVDYFKLTGLSDTSELAATHRAFQNENQNLVKLFPGVLETLKTLRAKNIKIAAATNRSRVTMETSLKHVGLEKIFDHIVTAEDVKNNKPAPDCVIKNMKYFSIEPTKTFMIGDHDVDIEAGKNAGVKTVGVTYGNKGEAIARAKPDFIINAITELLDLV